jgi:predicted Zn-dependent protease
MVNGYWNGNGYAGYGATGYGAGYGGGVAAWGAGSPMYGWGYSGYSNPYYGASAAAGGVSQNVAAQQSASAPQQSAATAYNYSQPISTTAAPPDQAIAGQATSAFDQAREAFKAGDYAQALQLDQQALAQMPNDTTLHEFLALVYFAQGKYDQAAAPLYAVLSVGPGWDWTTLSGMYADVATYTSQLRALEANVRANPDSAHGHFLLAYQYLAQGHIENGVAQLKDTVRLQPGDTLSAQLIAQLQPSNGTQPSPNQPTAVAQGKLAGNWTAAPGKDAKITLAIQDDGRFSWAATSPGRPATTITGGSSLADSVLTLTAQGSQDGALTGQVAWQDPDHFTFQLLGAPPNDPGLTFAR